MSLKAWKFFKTFLKEHGSTNGGGSLPDGFHHFIPEPTADDFTIYTQPLQDSSTFQFVAHVRICGTSSLRSHDLTHLAGLTNLAMLEIFEPPDERLPFPRLSDRLVRTWSEEKDPFPSLKILRILSLSLTDQSLAYVSKFDQLCFFEAAGRDGDWHSGRRLARELGWVHCHTQDPHTMFVEPDEDLIHSVRLDGDGGLDVPHMLRSLTGYIEARRQDFCAGEPVGRLNWLYWLYDVVLANHRNSSTTTTTTTPTPTTPQPQPPSSSSLRAVLRDEFVKTCKRPSYMRLNAEETYHTTELAQPIATLTLGKKALAAEPAAHTTGFYPFHEKAYFWRYWLPSGSGGGVRALNAASTSTPIPTAEEVALTLTLSPRPGYARHPRPQPPKRPAPAPADNNKDRRSGPVSGGVLQLKRRRRAEGANYMRDLLR